MNEHEKAIYKTLLVSLKTGLNASLTPEDSRALLKMLNPNTKKQRKENPLDRIAFQLCNALSNSLENLADDLEIPTKKRK